MTFWILPQLLTDEQRREALEKGELILPADGLASLARAQGPDQINDWLRHLHPDATPEHITSLTEHYWRLGHELLPEDLLIVRAREGTVYMVGEVAGNYRKEERAGAMSHIWPMKWLETNVTADRLPLFSQYAGYPALTEVLDENALISLRELMPALQKGNARFFKWLGIVILFFELIYFWPRG